MNIHDHEFCPLRGEPKECETHSKACTCCEGGGCEECEDTGQITTTWAQVCMFCDTVPESDEGVAHENSGAA